MWTFVCIQPDGMVKPDTVGTPVRDVEVKVADSGEGHWTVDAAMEEGALGAGDLRHLLEDLDVVLGHALESSAEVALGETERELSARMCSQVEAVRG